MKKFYKGKVDRVFKSIFANEDDPSLLQEFLSRLLDKKIEIIHFLKNEQPIVSVNDKTKSVDLLVKIDNEYTHLEVNTSSNLLIRTRNFNYFTNIYSRKTTRGQIYDFKTKFLHIDLNYNMPINSDFKYSYFIQTLNGDKYIDNFKIMVFNMDKYMKYWYTNDSENIDKYKHLIMLDLEENDLKKLSIGDDFVKEFEDKITNLNNQETFQSFMSYEDDQRLLNNSYKAMAYEEGMEKGTKIGVEKGIKQTKIETAKNMLELDIEIDKIIKVTGLSLSEINDLKTD